MGLTLVDFNLTPQDELTLKAIQNINKVCQNQIDAAYAKRQMESDRLLELHVQKYAKYIIGDMLQTSENSSKYMQVESISAEVRFGSSVVITYKGKAYKKFNGKMIRTALQETTSITELNAVKV